MLNDGVLLLIRYSLARKKWVQQNRAVENSKG